MDLKYDLGTWFFCDSIPWKNNANHSSPREACKFLGKESTITRVHSQYGYISRISTRSLALHSAELPKLLLLDSAYLSQFIDSSMKFLDTLRQHYALGFVGHIEQTVRVRYSFAVVVPTIVSIAEKRKNSEFTTPMTANLSHLFKDVWEQESHFGRWESGNTLLISNIDAALLSSSSDSENEDTAPLLEEFAENVLSVPRIPTSCEKNLLPFLLRISKAQDLRPHCLQWNKCVLKEHNYQSMQAKEIDGAELSSSTSEGSSEDALSGSYALGTWDQFGANEKLVQGPSTYSEELYTTPLPKDFTEEQNKRTNEILLEMQENSFSKPASHEIENVNNQWISEEDLFSRVIPPTDPPRMSQDI